LKILCINPNSSREITKAINEICRQYALRETEVETKRIEEAPEGIESYLDAHNSAIYIVKKFKKWEKQYDGFIIACHGDIGVDLLREMTTKPVIGIGEASMLLATILGHKFSILSLNKKIIPKKEDLIKKYGLKDRCASICVTELRVNDSYEKKKDKLIQAGERAVKKDGAEVLILGCGGMTGLDKEIENELQIPVIDGVVSALMIIESIIRYGLKTSKIGKYS